MLGSASLASASAAVVVVYLLGYVVGALLVEPKADRTTLALGVVRLIAGLLLTTVGFVLSLALSLPWLAGPVALFIGAVVVHGREAFDPPHPDFTFSWGSAVTGLVSITALSPLVIAAMRMAPGEFPPMFFNVDTPYFLEKVHALVTATVFPPESLSVVGGRWPYHYGVHGLAALISRSSGVAPHHSLFLIVLPLLAGGILAAAVLLARQLCPALPSVVAVPMLLVSVPTLWYSFWQSQVPVLQNGPLQSVTRQWEIWGLAANVGHNVAAHFLVLASLASIAPAPTFGWRLPVFLVGASVVFKSPTGVALVAGFGTRTDISRRRSEKLPAAHPGGNGGSALRRLVLRIVGPADFDSITNGTLSALLREVSCRPGPPARVLPGRCLAPPPSPDRPAGPSGQT